mmetsp:Transcript_113471/g.316010  ORF Transcript_113471/g.316010 Transcript_113471/m.316010 type:complete len:233 (+) Transcript_113471:604-1302(+)
MGAPLPAGRRPPGPPHARGLPPHDVPLAPAPLVRALGGLGHCGAGGRAAAAGRLGGLLQPGGDVRRLRALVLREPGHAGGSPRAPAAGGAGALAGVCGAAGHPDVRGAGVRRDLRPRGPLLHWPGLRQAAPAPLAVQRCPGQAWPERYGGAGVAGAGAGLGLVHFHQRDLRGRLCHLDDRHLQPVFLRAPAAGAPGEVQPGSKVLEHEGPSDLVLLVDHHTEAHTAYHGLGG